MNKLLTAIAVVIAVSATVPAQADGTAIVVGTMFLMGRASTQPTPANLTDACKAQTVQAQGGNYSFVSYEHCLKK